MTARSKRATIVDVARHARVSLGTASQALNNPEQVSPERLARVKQAIAELGYTRNALAQGLRAKRTSAIGLCVPHSRVAIFAALVYRFEELADAAGFQLMHVLSHEESEKELDRVKTLTSYGIAGLLLVPSIRPQLVLDFVAANAIPTVIVDRPVVGENRFDQVTVDNRSLMTSLASRLIELGHRRILLVARRLNAIATINRLEGLNDVKRAHGRNIRTHVIESGESEEVFSARMGAALAEHVPTAIITGNDVIAAWTLRELNARGLACPGDISVAVFDEPPWAEIVQPPMSTVRLAVNDMAVTAWGLLMSRIQDSSQECRHVISPAELKFRGSVGPPPAPRGAPVNVRTGRIPRNTAR